MITPKRTTLIPVLALGALAMGYFTVYAAARADDTPPPSPPPDQSAPHGRHHDDPAWQACRKQADDQKLERGEARHEFMRNCMKSAKQAAPPAS